MRRPLLAIEYGCRSGLLGMEQRFQTQQSLRPQLQELLPSSHVHQSRPLNVPLGSFATAGPSKEWLVVRFLHDLLSGCLSALCTRHSSFHATARSLRRIGWDIFRNSSDRGKKWRQSPSISKKLPLPVKGVDSSGRNQLLEDHLPVSTIHSLLSLQTSIQVGYSGSLNCAILFVLFITVHSTVFFSCEYVIDCAFRAVSGQPESTGRLSSLLLSFESAIILSVCIRVLFALTGYVIIHQTFG